MKRFVFAAMLISAVLAFSGAHAQSGSDEPDVRVILLGTGGPELTSQRFGYATLVVAGGQKLLFDAGRGVLQRIYESRIDPTEVTKVFFTHLHNDHTEGLAPLWLTPWFLLGRDKPMEVWGPVGTARLLKGMQEMFWFDVAHRVNKFNKVENIQIAASEIEEGEVYDRGGLKVTAFSVWHDDGNPAFGYRIDYKGRSVVLSGDTTYSANLVGRAKGVDLIVHNVIAMSPRLSTAPEMIPVLGKLTTPEQAARVFRETAPKMAVLSHVVKKELHGKHGDEVIVQRIRDAGYAGPLEMGYDRMVVEIGKTLRVFPPTTTDNLPDLDRKGAYAPYLGQR